MTTEQIAIDTDFGTITINRGLPDTVTLAVDDQIGAQRVLMLQIDEAYRMIDGLQNAIRYALTNAAPLSLAEWSFVTNEQVCVRTDFGSITIGNELPDTVALAIGDDQVGAQRVVMLQIGQAYQVIDAVRDAIRYALGAGSV